MIRACACGLVHIHFANSEGETAIASFTAAECQTVVLALAKAASELNRDSIGECEGRA